jgi:hypothetical protein
MDPATTMTQFVLGAARASVLGLAVIVVATARAQAGPWLPAVGHGYLQLREGFSWADERYDAQSRVRPVLSVGPDGTTAPSGWRTLETDLYFEAAVLPRLALAVDWVALRTLWQPQLDREASTASGVSDMTLSAKLLVFDDVLTLSILTAVTIPIGAATATLPLAPGDFRTELGIMVGKLFEPVPAFVAGNVGLVLRGAAEVTDLAHPGARVELAYQPEVRYLLEGGYALRSERPWLRRIYLIARLEGRYAGGLPVEDSLGILTPTSGAFLRAGGEVAWLARRWLECTVSASTFVVGRSVPALAEVALGGALLY